MRGIQDLPLNPSQSFESFASGPSNQSAHDAARRVVQMSDSEIPFLLIHGGAGMGKTHLLNAIALEARDKHQARVRFLRGFDFMRGILPTLNDERLREFRDEFRAADILLVDDFQRYAHSPTMSEFVDAVNAFIALERKVAIASDQLPSMWKGLSENLRLRFPVPVLIGLEKPDAATRLAILKAKCADIGNDVVTRLAILRAKCADIEKNGGERPVPEAVVERLAQGLDGSPRDILIRLAHLANHASSTGEPATMEQADRAIASARPPDRSAARSEASHVIPSRDTLYCSFCGKSQHEVLKLIAGPTVFICDGCVGLTAVMVAKEHRDWRDKWVEDLIRCEDPPPIEFKISTHPRRES